MSNQAPARGGFAAFADHAAAIADQAIHQGDMRAVGFALDEVGLRDIGRHKDMGFQTGCGGVGRERAGGVARRRDGHDLNTQFHAHGYGAG